MSHPPIRLAPPGEPIHWRLLLLADPSRERIAAWLPEAETWLWDERNWIKGLYSLAEIAPGVFEIKCLTVDPKWQREGRGKRLLEHAQARARERGGHTLRIATGNSSLPQLRLYQRVGFRIVGVDPDHFTDHYPEPIFEDGLQCRDRIWLEMKL